jgi:WD40 repeat protein
VTISADDKLVVLALGTGTDVEIASVSSGRTLAAGGYHGNCSGPGNPPAVSRDDRLVATFSSCGQVLIREAATGKRVSSLRESEQLSSVAFDPTGARLAVASIDNRVTVWNVRTSRPLVGLVGHTGAVTGVAYSPNGRFIATTSADHTMRVWDAASGRLLRIHHDVGTTYLPTFSTNGTTVVDNNLDDHVSRVWDTCSDCENPDQLLKQSQSAVSVFLTPREQTEAAAG